MRRQRNYLKLQMRDFKADAQGWGLVALVVVAIVFLITVPSVWSVLVSSVQ